MKKTSSIVLSLFIGICIAGAQSISPSVIATAGGFASNDNVSLSWTLGEVAVTTLTDGNIILTQGFQQPWETDPSAVFNKELNWSILTWPNPVHDQIRVRFSLDVPMDFTLEIIDLTGKMMKIRNLENVVPGQEIEVDFSFYPQGMYLMKIASKDRKYQRTIRIQKY